MSVGPTFQHESSVLQRLTALLLIESPRHQLPLQHCHSNESHSRSPMASYELDTWPDHTGHITQLLERLLYQLDHVTERRRVEYQGQVRGRVVWPATYKARYAEHFDRPVLFAARCITATRRRKMSCSNI